MLENIFGKPVTVCNLEVYPVKVKYYEEFNKFSYVFTTSLRYLKFLTKKDYPDFDFGDFNEFDFFLLMDGFAEDMKKILKIITKEDFSYLDKYKCFVLADDFSKREDLKMINRDNFALFKKVIMRQNILFETKFYENEELQEMYESMVKVHRLTNGKITFEDMVGVVSFIGHVPIDEIYENYTIYQLNSAFARIQKLEDYRTSVLAKVNGADNKIENFATEIDLYEDPQDKFGFMHKSDIEDGISLQKIFS